MIRDACISDCGKYRYWLSRTWVPFALPRLCYIMLNPSTADAEQDDPTITRCIQRAKHLNFGSITVVNLFAWRATDPLELWNVPDPIGPDNDATICQVVMNSERVICGWGIQGAMMQRDTTIRKLLRDAGVQPYALRLTKGGHPAHPLYLPYSLQPEPMK